MGLPPTAGDLEVLQSRPFVLKEGVDYRVKVSFKVRWMRGALCPLAELGTALLLPHRVRSATHGSLLPWRLWLCAPLGGPCPPRQSFLPSTTSSLSPCHLFSCSVPSPDREARSRCSA